MKVEVKTIDNRKKGDIESSLIAIFAIEPRADIVARVVKWQLAKRRAGTHLVKGVATSPRQVRKCSVKGYRAHACRVACAVSHNAWRCNYFPAVRSHAHSLPKKVRKLGYALGSVCKDGRRSADYP